MSPNKLTVQKYMDCFNKSDHGQILSCLTDDIEWLMPGAFHLVGKDAFDKEIENDAFVGRPTIKTIRMTEENEVVVAEGTVRCARKAGGFLNAVFCDVFAMEGAKIQRLTTYLAELKEQQLNEQQPAPPMSAPACAANLGIEAQAEHLDAYQLAFKLC